MTKPKIIYRWWFIAICFLSFFLIPVGLLLWILKTRELTAQKKALEEQCGQYETANNNLDETLLASERRFVIMKRLSNLASTRPRQLPRSV